MAGRANKAVPGKFALDSPLAESGFEPLVPLTLNLANAGGEREKFVTAEYEVGGAGCSKRWLHGTGHPSGCRVIDLAKVSAAGGSIAWIDEGGPPSGRITGIGYRKAIAPVNRRCRPHARWPQ
jgi:hypothetical protein